MVFPVCGWPGSVLSPKINIDQIYKGIIGGIIQGVSIDTLSCIPPYIPLLFTDIFPFI